MKFARSGLFSRYGRWFAAGLAIAMALPALADPIPYTSLQDAETPPTSDAPNPAQPSAPPEQAQTAAPDLKAPAMSAPLSIFREAVRAARAGDAARATALSAGLADANARKVVLWVLIDNAATRLDFTTLDNAIRDLAGWPRGYRRLAGAEKAIEAASLPPQKVIDWFNGRDPETPEGGMALAAAFQSLGQMDNAKDVVRHIWRDHIFELDAQRRMLARFGLFLSADDHNTRLSTLLYAQQGPAARAMMDMVDADHQVLANARVALRAERPDAADAVEKVPQALRDDPGLAFDRARYYRRKNLEVIAAGQIKNFPVNVPEKSDVQGFIWGERRALMLALIRSKDNEDAYAAATDTGLKPGPDLAEAEFYAGWIALQRLHDPVLADRHFAGLQASAQSSITISRAYYWRGRAAQAHGDEAAAMAWFNKGAAYYTSFYGLLSAEAAGHTMLTIGHDPTPGPTDRLRFEARDINAGARLLAQIGDRENFRSLVLAAADTAKKTEDFVQLVDMSRANGDSDLALRVARLGNYRGYYLPERGYPVRDAPQPAGAAEPAFMLAITRQESSFDAHARSYVGARGLMQLMPATAAGLAHNIGVHYAPARLDEPEYNMQLGGVYLGHLVSRFGGSYVLATAAYNAGPGRPSDWVNTCGDPRTGVVEPTDFIECIPFTETRNYVMRVMENNAIYRARLNNGSAPLTLAEDLKRGRWAPPPTTIDSILENLSGSQ